MSKNSLIRCKELMYVPRNYITPRDEAALTVKKVNFFGTHKGEYTLMRYKGGRVGVPRYYFHFDPLPPVQGKWDKVSLNFKATLRDYQKPIVETYLNKLSDNPYGGIIQMPTGSGKTVVGLAVAYAIGLRTMVVVHTEVIRNQWLEAIEKFTGLKPGLIQQGTRGIQPITVAMIQTLLNVEMDKNIFGHVIYDEVHIMGAEKFSETVPKFNPMIRTGLSATPERKDGKTYIFKWHIGPIISRMTSEMVEKRVMKIQYADPKTSSQGCYQAGKFIRSRYNKKLNVPRRNRLVAQLAMKCYHKDYVTLILSDSIDLLREYERLIEAPVAWVIGERKTYDGTQKIILGTYQAAGIGFDAPEINCVILATPRANVTQAIGRLSRYKGDKPVVIIDIVDVLCRMSNNYWKRKVSKDYDGFKVFTGKRVS